MVSVTPLMMNLTAAEHMPMLEALQLKIDPIS